MNQGLGIWWLQRQLDAYNARDVEAILATYAADAQQFEHPAKLLATGTMAARLFARQAQDPLALGFDVGADRHVAGDELRGQIRVGHQHSAAGFDDRQGVEALLPGVGHLRLGSPRWIGAPDGPDSGLQVALSDDQGWLATFEWQEQVRPEAVTVTWAPKYAASCTAK